MQHSDAYQWSLLVPHAQDEHSLNLARKQRQDYWLDPLQRKRSALEMRAIALGADATTAQLLASRWLAQEVA